MCRTIIATLLLAVSSGCVTSTPVAVVDDPQTITDSRGVVLNCTVIAATNRWNFNFSENYLGPMPTRVEGGEVSEVSLRVNSVVKGSFGGQTLRIKDAQTPSQKEPSIGAMRADAIRSGEQLIVGFDRGLFWIPHNYVISRGRAGGT